MKRATVLKANDAESSKRYRLQSYRENYTKEWPCLVHSKSSEHHIFCTICCCDINISHGGRDDCRRHMETMKHKEKKKEKCGTLDKFLSSASGEKSDDPTHAELMFTSFVIEHNLPISTADHAKNLFKVMFPDSKIAKRFSCGRTKTTALIHSLAQNTTKNLLSIIRNVPFSLATDGSSDFNSKKLYPIVITYFNEEKGRNSTVLLTIAESVDNTGKGIFNAINNVFQQKNLNWKNCLSFSCDNASAMIGHIKGVVSYIKEIHPSLILSRCSCHLIHLAAKHAAYKLSFDFEQFIIQIFFYLEKSSKRKYSFQESQSLCEVKPHKILKHISTRWLSLQLSIDRVLEQWEALEHFFSNQPENQENNTQLKFIRSSFMNPLSKLYLLFLSSVLPIFTSVNQDLQHEAPQIHKLKRKFNNLLMDIVTRFMKPSVISDAENISGLNVEKKKNQKLDCDLVIGGKTRAFKESLTLNENDSSSFYKSVRLFYSTAYSYIVKKFPLDEEFLNHVEAADVKLRKTAKYSSVKYLASLLNFSMEEMDKLESEFSLYQIENLVFEDDERMDEAWHKISLIKKENESLKYRTLSKLMKIVLTVPHSNAPTERIFSIVKRNMTEFRPNLSIESLNSLLVEKIKSIADSKVCYQREFSASEINAAKKATAQHF